MTTTDLESGFRLHLRDALRGGNAFDSFEDIVAGIPQERRFEPIGQDNRSPWQILEHMRICLDDLADYSANEDKSYFELDWPSDYWPNTPAPSAEESWEETVEDCRNANLRIEALIMDPKRDLLEPFPWAPDHTLLRELLIAIQHNGYHLGQLVELSGIKS